jgi:DNA primase
MIMGDEINAIRDYYESHHPFLSHRRGQWPDRRGEFWALCPFHGDNEPGSFSFSERGYKCFACDARGGLRKLAEALGLADNTPLPFRRPRRVKPAPKPREAYWQKQPDIWRQFLDLPDIARDYYHQRGFTDATIERWRLGYGVLPASRCKHPRLIWPIFEDGQLVAIKGRAIHPEDTDKKWLQSAGGRAALFGTETLGQGKMVIIAEAPYSAMLAHQEAPEIAALAIGGATVWRDEWTAKIIKSQPSMALVWLDYDSAGLGGAVKIVNSLLAAGVRARLYHWPPGTPEKCDLADVVLAVR